MKLFKQSLCSLLLIALVLPFYACGKDAEFEKPTVAAPEVAEEIAAPSAALDNSKVITVQVVNREEVYPFSAGTRIKSIARIDSTLLLLSEDRIGAYLGICEYALENGRPNLTETRPLQMAELPFEGDAIHYALTAGGDGNFYLLSGNNMNNASTILVIQKYSSTGEFIECMEISDWDLMTVDAFSVGAAGEVLLAADSTVCVYRWLGGMLKCSSGDFLVYSSSMSGAGLVLSTFSLTDHLGHYSLVNGETGELEPLPLSDTEPSGDDSLLLYRVCGSVAPCQGLNGEYLINQGRSICLLDFENDSVAPLIEWNPDYQWDLGIGAACRLGESAFACLADGRLVLAWSQTVEKRESGIVRVGVIDGVASQNVTKTVERMNTADCPYIYETTVFNSDEQGLNKFRAELATGAFDLIVFHNEINTGSSSFEDLYPYIDGDEELSRESFIPNLLSSMSIHGELHQIWNSVMISTMIAREDIVGDGRRLTVVDCERLVAENRDIQSLLDNKLSDENTLKQDLLQNIAYTAMAAFVDTEVASCSFDSEEFMNLLSLCDRIKANPDSTGNDFLLYSQQVGGADALSYKEQTIGPCAFVGYPDGADGIHYYMLPNDFEHCMAAAIPANSQNKQGAWNFIKMLLSRSNQLSVANTFGAGIPVVYDIVKETGDRMTDARSATQFYDLLTRTKCAELYGDATLRDIIIENGQAYIAGGKTLQETAQLIQSKASLYLSEQYG